MIRSFLHLAILDPDIAESENVPRDLGEIIHTIAKDKNVVYCNNTHLDNSNASKCLQQVIFNSLHQNGLIIKKPKYEGNDLNKILLQMPRDLPVLVISKKKFTDSIYPNVNYLKAHSDEDKFNSFLRRIPIKIPQKELVNEIINIIKVLKYAGNTGPFKIEFLDPYLNDNFLSHITYLKLFEHANIEFSFCRTYDLSKDYINKTFEREILKELSDIKKQTLIYPKFNKWLKDQAEKRVMELKSFISRKYGSELLGLQNNTSKILFKYYYVKHDRYSQQACPDASTYAFSDLKNIWHHRSFKISAGDNNLFCNSYESAHSFIYPGPQIHDASEPLHFRLVSNKEFGSVLKQDVWDSPYIMDINGPIK
jgi:hypothetical protein